MKRRSAAQGSSHDEKADQPRSGADEDVPAIFLSHSGKQKPFVEHLYDALQRANHTAFFDQHTLPKGSPFPPHINRAARGCKLGVVVLSDDFLTSKWPMLELEMLVQQRGPDAKVLPLFYKLHPRDLKSPENLSKWRCMWKEKAGDDQHADKWEQAVKALDAFNGEIFIQGASEDAYIKRVVRTICNLVPSHASHDLSPIQGRQRLAKEVARQFEHADARQCEKARMVGLHGLGGLGKTTMCKIMVNFYNSEYHLLEFPTDGNDKLIVQECKKALKKFTNLSNERLLNEADSFDQVVQLMGENLRRYDVFLAIDNVWESSQEAAERILGVSFSANSKILLTSRSHEQFLKELLRRGHSNTSVCPLPAPEHEEGFQIFQETFQLGDLNSLVNRNQLDRVLERCMFSGTYHALALKALSKHVKSVCVLGDLENIEHHLSLILEEISYADLLNVEDVIRLNYENLPEHKKHMFLDIAVLFPFMMDRDVEWFSRVDKDEELTYANACQWLSSLYKEFPKSKIMRLIYELALDGLIQLEERDGHAKKIIRVHDLFFELAHREAASSSRFFTELSNKLVEEIEWEKLGRVILCRGDENPHFIEKLQQQECRKLQVLYATADRYTESWSGGIHLDLDLMPSLCVLNLERVTLRSIKNWTAAKGLAIIILSDLECAQPLEPIPSMPSLERLTIDDVKTVEGPPNLDGCLKVKRLVLSEASLFEKGEELHLGASYFNSLTNLESLHIEHRASIRVLNLNTLVQLQWLHVHRCEFIERIEGLDALKNLQGLDVGGCPRLKNLDGLSGLLQLRALYVEKCVSLKKMLDVSGLTCLEMLVLNGNDSMEEVIGLSSTLQDCGALKKMPDLISSLTCLERLELERLVLERLVSGRSVSQFYSQGQCVGLKSVNVIQCGALKKMPDLSSLTCLETLTLHCNGSMKEVGGLSSTLKDVSVTHCRALKKMPDMSGLSCLERLELEGNESMEEVGGQYLSSTLKYLRIRGCSSVRSFPSLNECVNLQTLSLTASAHVINMVSSDQYWKGLSLLQYLRIEECDSINKLDLSPLTNLKCLKVADCEALEEIAGLSALQSLEDLELCKCQSLKKVGGFMSLCDCGSLEESTIPDKSLLHTIKNIHIERCGELKEMEVGSKYCYH